MTGRLFVVSTPIGNLGDLSQRAVETLRSVAQIVAEDTRHSRTLLDRYEVPTRTAALHEHNEAREAPRLVARMLAGEDLALISDAGTPLLSDPGLRLVRAAVDAGVVVVPIPGASALLAGLVASGLATVPFTFFGFLARSGRERREQLEQISALGHTGVLYEAPGRVGGTLQDLDDAGCGDREAVVARELTKQYEEVRRSTVRDLAVLYADHPPRGEVVILIAGREAPSLDEEHLRTTAREMLAAGAAPREVARVLRDEHGAPRNLAYRLSHPS